MPEPKFKQYLDNSGEIGSVVQVYRSIVYVDGLPHAKLSEEVIFENGEMGQIMSLQANFCEVLLFSREPLRIGTKVTRTLKTVNVKLSPNLLGQVLNAYGTPVQKISSTNEERHVDMQPSGLANRTIKNSFETGFMIVDLLVPLGIGQRELILGDRKTGKSSLLQGIMLTQALKGTICIYVLIGKRNIDIKKTIDYAKEKGIMNKCIIVASSATDSAGMIYLSPYTAMTIAEYFRDQGNNVLLILDDMTTHAQYYREITLQARRFPGRSSYPGDIFYIQAKLLERAGSFKNGTITCLPVAESVMGDLAGYIQTNLMAITDGHIFFDTDSFNEGRRPAINPYLSVTRVGQQAQTPLLRDVSRQLSRFLSRYQKLKELIHFGSEFEDRVRKELSLGDKIFMIFNQTVNQLQPTQVSILIIGALWNGWWNEATLEQLKTSVRSLNEMYLKNSDFAAKCNNIVNSSKTLEELTRALRENRAALNF